MHSLDVKNTFLWCRARFQQSHPYAPFELAEEKKNTSILSKDVSYRVRLIGI